LDTLDNRGGLSRTEVFVRKGAEATAGNFWIAESMRQNADQ